MSHLLRKFLSTTTEKSTTLFPGAKHNPLMLFTLVGLVGIAVGYISAASQVTAVNLIGVLGLLAVTFLALKYPFYGFLFLITVLPLEAAFVLEVGFTIRLAYLVLVGITFIILCQFALDRPSGSFSSPLTLPIFLYLGISALSMVMTLVNPPPTVELSPEVELRGTEFRSVIQLAFLYFSSLAYFYTLYFCSNDSRISVAVRTHIYCAIAISFYGTYQFLAYIVGLPFIDITNALGTGGGVYHASTYGSWSYFRPHATFQEPLNFGHYLLSALPLVCALALYQSKIRTTAWNVLQKYSLPILIMIIALFLTRSRGAWIGFFGGMLFLLVVVNWKDRLRVFASAILASVAIYMMMTFFLPDVFDIFGKVVAERFSGAKLTHGIRFRFFPFTIALFQQYPILGVGIGNFPLHQAAEFGMNVPGTAYGVFWQSLVESGILGFVAFGFLLFRFYQVLLRAVKDAQGGPWYPYLVGYLASITALMIQYLSFGDRLNLYVWFLMGLAISTVKVIETQRITA